MIEVMYSKIYASQHISSRTLAPTNSFHRKSGPLAPKSLPLVLFTCGDILSLEKLSHQEKLGHLIKLDKDHDNQKSYVQMTANRLGIKYALFCAYVSLWAGGIFQRLKGFKNKHSNKFNPDEPW